MFKTEPNTSKHQPEELPFLVRNTENDLIIRYSATKDEADSHTERLNRVYFPSQADSADPAPNAVVPVAAESELAQNESIQLALF